MLCGVSTLKYIPQVAHNIICKIDKPARKVDYTYQTLESVNLCGQYYKAETN